MGSVKLNHKRILILFVIVAIIVLMVGLTLGTSKPGFCNTCHEMQPAYNAWATSNHAIIDCGSCHAEFNLALVNFTKTKIRILKDFAAHLRGDYAAPLNKKSTLSTTSSFESCATCHSSKRLITVKILIPHELHAGKLGIACVYCHNRVGHPGLKGYEDRTKMRFCIDCHKKRQISVDCRTCHPKGPPPSRASLK